jgi:hypothetical protein
MKYCIRCGIRSLLAKHEHSPKPRTGLSDAEQVPNRDQQQKAPFLIDRSPAVTDDLPQPAGLTPDALTDREQENLRTAFLFHRQVQDAQRNRPEFAHLFEGFLTTTSSLGKGVLLDAAERIAADSNVKVVIPDSSPGGP